MEREKEIQAGTSSWPFPDLGPGECVLTDDYKDPAIYPEYANLKVGDKIAWYGDFYYLWHATGSNYNEFVRAEGAPEQSTSLWKYYGDDCTIIECTIKGFVEAENGWGKFPNKAFWF